MNVRDPFNRQQRYLPAKGRRPGAVGLSPAFSILRATATRAAADLLEAGTQATQALATTANTLLQDDERASSPSETEKNHSQDREAEEDMSAFSIPKNVPSFTNPQRQLEDRLWPSSGSGSSKRKGGATLQNRVGDFLTPNRGSLPMYKDKPYAYAPSGRSRPLLRRKRVCGLFLLVVLGMVWWTGLFAEHKEKAKLKLGQWGWVKTDAGKAKGGKDWLRRRERVVEAMQLSWGAYERYAWGEFPLWVLKVGVC